MYAHIGTPKTDRPRRRRRCRAQHPFARSRLRAVAVLLVLSLTSHRHGSQPASFLASVHKPAPFLPDRLSAWGEWWGSVCANVQLTVRRPHRFVRWAEGAA